MKHSGFPEIIRCLPEAEISQKGVRAYICQAEAHQVIFMEFENDVEVPVHSHGAQWGIVIEGEIELTIAGSSRVYRKGDTYFIPEGTLHSAKIKSGYADVTLFAEPGRYKKKGQAGTISFTNIDHIVLTVRDIQETCNFYSEVLGMEIIEFNTGRRALRFGKEKMNLHEYGKEYKPNAKNASPGTADICLITETPISIFINHLQQKGIDIIGGPVERSGTLGKIRSIYIHDPDGNLIEISNYI